MSVPSSLTKGIIAVVCVSGFYFGLRTARQQPNDVPSVAPASPIGENLQRKQSALGDARAWYSELELAATDNDKDVLARMRKGVLATLTRAQLDEVVRLIDSETDSFRRSRMVEAIAERWAELDPEAALAFVTNRVHTGRQHKAYTTMLKAVAKKDGDKAYKLLLATEASNTKSVGSLGESAFEVFREWKKTSPEAALAAIQEGRIHKYNADAALYAVCRAENAAEREGVFSSVGEIESPELQRKAWGKVAYSWAKTAPLSEMVEWIDGKEFDPETVAMMEREIAGRKAKDRPEEIANWLVERASPDSLPQHLETAVQSWAHSQPNACAAWLHTMELGPQTDRAVAAFSRSTVDHDPESAFTWAQQVHDATLREEAVSDVAARIFRFDPTRLTQALASSGLKPEVQARVLKRVKQF